MIYKSITMTIMLPLSMPKKLVLILATRERRVFKLLRPTPRS